MHFLTFQDIIDKQLDIMETHLPNKIILLAYAR